MSDAGSTIIGAFLGGAIGVIGTYFGAIKIADRNRNFDIFNDAAGALRNGLIKTKQKLEITKEAYSVVRDDFLNHDELRRRFELHLFGDDFTGFTEAWNHYQNWYKKIACAERGALDYPYMLPHKDDADFQRALTEKPEDLIDHIIPYTKHK